MKEIGGYFELDKYMLPMLHDGCITLNSGRNCLAYIIRKRKIHTLHVPKFLCSAVDGVCRRENVRVKYYSIDKCFMPESIVCGENEWIYIVNYYGQLDNDTIKKLKQRYSRIIVDNVQAYFQKPIDGIDTIYTCRKFFGVPDGAFLATDLEEDDKLADDESFEKMKFILGRFERTASEFYNEYAKREEVFEQEDVKHMSKLTSNLLHGINYDFVKNRRSENYEFLHSKLECLNELNVSIIKGAYMYPLYVENGSSVRKILQQDKIYISTLWPDVFELCSQDELEYRMAENILPIPVDQRYTEKDMNYIVNKIFDAIKCL